LTGCGASEFETKVAAWCEKGGTKGGSMDWSQYDCACAAGEYDDAFDADQKTIFLVARVEGHGSAGDVETGVIATGAWKKGDDSKGLYAVIRVFTEAENKAKAEIAKSCKKA
jgi:hypothetical protein